jgi:hypothetical protein
MRNFIASTGIESGMKAGAVILPSVSTPRQPKSSKLSRLWQVLVPPDADEPGLRGRRSGILLTRERPRDQRPPD